MFLCLFAGTGPPEMLAGSNNVIKVKSVLSSFSCRPWSNSTNAKIEEKHRRCDSVSLTPPSFESTTCLQSVKTLNAKVQDINVRCSSL